MTPRRLPYLIFVLWLAMLLVQVAVDGNHHPGLKRTIAGVMMVTFYWSIYRAAKQGAYGR